MTKRRTIFTLLALGSMLLAYGSLQTIHATTAHACSRHANSNGHPSTCLGHLGTQYKTVARAHPDDAELPTWPICPTCPPDTCICPWDSWACFLASSVDPKTPPLYRTVFSRHSAQQLLRHGLFYRAV